MTKAMKLSETFLNADTQPAPVLHVPQDIMDDCVIDRFFKSRRTIDYTDRLYAAGFHHMGDMHGKTEKEIRSKARTTDKNWELFKWALGTYDAHFK